MATNTYQVYLEHSNSDELVLVEAIDEQSALVAAEQDATEPGSEATWVCLVK